MTKEQRDFLKTVPGLHSMPSPLKTGLVLGAVGAGLGWLIAKKPLKWGAITGGAAFAGTLIAEVSYGAGVAATMYRAAYPRAVTSIPRVALPSGHGSVRASDVWPEGVEAPPPDWFEPPADVTGWYGW